MGVCFGQRSLGNHGNLPNCYGSLQIPEIIFHKPCLNLLQTYGRPGRFVQRRALTGDELSFIPQGEPAYIFRRPGNKQIFLSVLTRRIFKLLSNLCLILSTFQRGHHGTPTAFETLLLNHPRISSISSFKQRIKQLKLTLRGSISSQTTRLKPGDNSGLRVPGCSAVSWAQRS